MTRANLKFKIVQEIADKVNNVKNIKNGENEVTPNEKLDNKDQNKKKKKDIK